MSDDELLKSIKSGSFGFAEDFLQAVDSAETDDEDDFGRWYDTSDSKVTTDVLVFDTADRMFALPLGPIRSVVSVQSITPYPSAHSWMLGGFQQGNEVYPIVDLEQFLAAEPGTDRSKVGRRSKILLVDTDNRTIGFLVGSVRRAFKVDMEDLKEVPNEIRENLRNLYDAVVDIDLGSVFILSVSALFQAVGESGDRKH